MFLVWCIKSRISHRERFFKALYLEELDIVLINIKWRMQLCFIKQKINTNKNTTKILIKKLSEKWILKKWDFYNSNEHNGF